jgi:long-chain acyl-CoA synthetase
MVSNRVKQIVIFDRQVPASQISKEASSIAGWLSDNNIRENDVVALLMWNDVPIFSVAEACGRVGAFLVLLNWHLTRPELDYILSDSGAKVLFGHSHLLAAAGLAGNETCPVVAVPPAREIMASFSNVSESRLDSKNWTDWHDLLAHKPYAGTVKANTRSSIFYTSGTTGKPKGVVRQVPSDDISRAARQRSAKGLGLDTAGQGLLNLVCCPLYHSAPFAHAMMSWNAGFDVVLMPRFDPQQFLNLAVRFRATHSLLVPTMFSRLLALPEADRAKFAANHLVAIAHGAAPCPILVKQRMIEWWGPVIREYYAGTETGVLTASTSQEWMAHPGTVGRTIDAADVRAIDDAGVELPRGKSGRLIARTESTQYFHYLGRGGPPVIEGWEGYVWLGDIGYVDPDGFVFLTDRSSDIVVAGGVNIYPAEIELELAAIAGVADSAVFGVPAPDLGEGIVAVVERAAGSNLDEATIIEALSLKLARYKLPRRVVFVEKLPREESGKLRKRLLRSEYTSIFSD